MRILAEAASCAHSFVVIAMSERAGSTSTPSAQLVCQVRSLYDRVVLCILDGAAQFVIHSATAAIAAAAAAIKQREATIDKQRRETNGRHKSKVHNGNSVDAAQAQANQDETRRKTRQNRGTMRNPNRLEINEWRLTSKQRAKHAKQRKSEQLRNRTRCIIAEWRPDPLKSERQATKVKSRSPICRSPSGSPLIARTTLDKTKFARSRATRMCRIIIASQHCCYTDCWSKQCRTTVSVNLVAFAFACFNRKSRMLHCFAFVAG